VMIFIWRNLIVATSVTYNTWKIAKKDGNQVGDQTN